MSSVKGSASNLVEAMKELNAEWERARSYWRDVKMREFEERYLDSLPNDIGKARMVMEEIDELIKKVRSDCE